MKAELLKRDGCVVSFGLEVPRETLATIEKETIDRFALKASVRGFRPGKAPRHIVISRYRDKIRQEILDKQLGPFCHQALESITIQPLTFPVLEELHYELEGSLSLKGRVEIAPEFTLPAYRGLTLFEASEGITPEEVDQAMQRVAEAGATMQTIEDRPLQEGDLAICNYIITAEDQTLETKEGIWIQVGEDAGIPGLSGILTGMPIGETRDLEVTLPENYVEEAHAGKPARLTVTLMGIRVRNIPVIDEEFIRKMDIGCDSVESYQEKLRERLVFMKQREIRNERTSRITDQLLQGTELEVPPSLVRRQAEEIYHHHTEQMRSQGTAESALKTNHEAIWQASFDQAVRQLKLEFICNRLLDEESVTVSEEECTAALEREAASLGATPEAHRVRLKAEDQWDNFVHRLKIAKLFDFLIQNAKFAPRGEEAQADQGKEA